MVFGTRDMFAAQFVLGLGAVEAKITKNPNDPG
jgi:hypothetical protein